ncbi:MAG: acetylglutamate kinase [Dehalococcoidia bacterium]|nr:acetylglutamate kinase [Dehalococcoidia bacterium]|tara:strand:+ start:1261 stop:2046 length:786 start_codon:yes stop_codon:yes gene_type:complete
MKEMKEIVVIKLGGSTLSEMDNNLKEIADLHISGIPVVIVHGGGALISEWMNKLEIKTDFIDGLRVTDENSIQIVTSILGGLVNKTLVASIINKNCKAIGLSGIDDNIFTAKFLDQTHGYVGNIINTNSEFVELLLNKEYLPVIAPIAINNELIDPPLLNINGDIAASALAVSLQADKLIFLTDVDGVLDENSKLISTLNTAQSKSLISNGTAKSGMIPKINSCIDAVESNVESFIINGTKYGNLTSIIKNSESVGTKFLV